jgi:hypothetical protein
MSEDLAELRAEIDLLRARIIELEAELVLLRGTLAQPDPDTPTQITHNHPPDAPR